MSRSAPFSLTALLCAAVIPSFCFVTAVSVSAIDTETAGDKVAATQPTDEGAAETEPPDPFAVPQDASPRELLKFIAAAKKQRGKTITTVMKSATAVADAAEQLFNHADATQSQRIDSVREQLSSLGFVSRYDPKARKRLSELTVRLQKDEDPAVRVIAKKEQFKSRIASAASASKQDNEALAAELATLVQEQGFDRDVFSIASSLIRNIGYSEAPEIAAELSEQVAHWMESSDDEVMVQRAPTMIGTARRLRLPNKFMDVFGETTGGDEFDWSEYRGKVVLVDFWASWCGPCRAEIPNMKRNLEAYGDKGFAIVGINMDRTRKACETCVEKEEISWINLVGVDKKDSSKRSSMASHYGISAIPTAILVDQDGKVVSMRARGEELDRLLQGLLGLPDDSDDTEDKAANNKDSSNLTE